ncbi:DUF4192 family protein [Arthrobacter sp. M4]|uniref:DUF4192 family protein n=1 Tax=Arthrobacter sp. M4 TaxID=218160 RepID=UPI001CDD0FB5|nr:DUF4192 family protein [Arthrobacter sp. M4]MCA4132736.1 DUF4192 domain-containing protein [Arthrobacter sp. M4]
MTLDKPMIATAPEDILGFVPHVLGYWPDQSLVAMTTQGNSLGATLRVDLPDTDRPDQLAAFAEQVSDYLSADEKADGVLLAVFTDSGWETNSVGGTWRPMLSSLAERLAASGTPVKVAWLVGHEYWRDASCDDERCCPLPGRSVQLIKDSRVNAEMVYRGSSVRQAPSDVDIYGDCAPYMRSLATAEDGSESSEDGFLSLLEPHWRDRACFEAVLHMWSSLRVAKKLRSGEISLESANFLRATLRVPGWRDAIAVMAAAGFADAYRGADDFGFLMDAESCDAGLPDGVPVELLQLSAQATRTVCKAGPSEDGSPGAPAVAVHGTTAVAATYGDVLLGLAPDVPDWTAMQTLDDMLKALAGFGGGEARAACLTLRGWIEWCRGRGSYADSLYRAALRELPSYRLAELLQEVVLRGTLCGWARRSEAAWRRFGTAAA